MEAHKKCNALLELLGPEWEPSVWHNINWCYCAKRGGWSIHPSSHDKGYTAYLNEVGSGGGGIWAASGTTPEDAIYNTLSKAHDELDSKLAIVSAGEEAAASLLKRRAERTT